MLIDLRFFSSVSSPSSPPTEGHVSSVAPNTNFASVGLLGVEGVSSCAKIRQAT